MSGVLEALTKARVAIRALTSPPGWGKRPCQDDCRALNEAFAAIDAAFAAMQRELDAPK